MAPHHRYASLLGLALLAFLALHAGVSSAARPAPGSLPARSLKSDTATVVQVNQAEIHQTGADNTADMNQDNRARVVQNDGGDALVVQVNHGTIDQTGLSNDGSITSTSRAQAMQGPDSTDGSSTVVQGASSELTQTPTDEDDSPGRGSSNGNGSNGGKTKVISINNDRGAADVTTTKVISHDKSDDTTSAAGGVLVADGDFINAQTRTQVTDKKASATMKAVAVDIPSRGGDGSSAGSGGYACTGSATECGR